MIFELSLAAALILYFVVLIGIPIIVRWTDIANLIGKFLVILRTCMSVQIFIFISCCACKVVKHQTVMVVERFGKFHRACRSDNGFGGTGLHFLIPCMDSPRAIKWRRKEVGNRRATTHEVVMHTVDLREQLMDFEHQKIITRDNVRHDSDPTVAFTKTIPWDMGRMMFSYWFFLSFFFFLLFISGGDYGAPDDCFQFVRPSPCCVWDFWSGSSDPCFILHKLFLNLNTAKAFFVLTPPPVSRSHETGANHTALHHRRHGSRRYAGLPADVFISGTYACSVPNSFTQASREEIQQLLLFKIKKTCQNWG